MRHPHKDNGLVHLDGLVDLEQAPWPCEQVLREKDHESLRDVDACNEEVAQVGEVGGIEEDGAAEDLLECVVEVAGFSASRRLDV